MIGIRACRTAGVERRPHEDDQMNALKEAADLMLNPEAQDSGSRKHFSNGIIPVLLCERSPIFLG
jgi:hypothetical protein